MLCPKCKNLLRIAASRVEVTGDGSPETQTRVFTVQELVCRSPQCPEYGKAAAENRVQTYPAEEA